MGENTSPNPLYDDIKDDLMDRSKWAKIDAEILRRRLNERRRKRTKPYVGAPNGVVPIVDDTVTEKTDQEITMMMNAPRRAYFIPLSKAATEHKDRAEMAFSTYLDHICRYRPKAEEAVDTKNARGYSILKVIRTNDERFGQLPDFEAVDPRDCIVPVNTKEIKKAERITFVLRYNERELRARAFEKGWNILPILEAKKSHTDSSDTTESSALTETKSLVGVSLGGKNTEEYVIFECWHHATEWTVSKDTTGEIELGRKACVLFSPDMPEHVVHIFPWKEDDIRTPLDEVDSKLELMVAAQEGRQPILYRERKGPDREWPVIQARAENRSRYFYDTRGIGHKCMDDQIYASGIFNAKMTWIDYLANPIFESEESDTNSSNFTAEPGSILKRGMKFATYPNIPPVLDFSVDYHKREAGRRSGVGSQYNYSQTVSSSRKIEKTATEVSLEQQRIAYVSSASVDRFNDPWIDLFRLLWEDLGRLKIDLPMLNNGKYLGNAGVDIYSMPFLIVPSASAKTLYPDLQFARAKDALGFVAAYQQFGVPADFHKGVKQTLSHYDPCFAEDVIIDPTQAGPQAQPPIYQVLQNLQKAVTELADIVDSKSAELTDVQKLSVEHDDTIKKLEQNKEQDNVPVP